MASQRRRAARPRAVRALVTSVMVGGSEKGQRPEHILAAWGLRSLISAPPHLRSEFPPSFHRHAEDSASPGTQGPPLCPFDAHNSL